MTTTELVIAADTSGPGRVLRLAGVDLTGHALEMIVAARCDAWVFSLENGGLALSVTREGAAPVSRITWRYSREFSNALPIGRATLWDLYATLDERHRIASGAITVDGPGQLSDSPETVIEIPGMQGPINQETLDARDQAVAVLATLVAAPVTITASTYLVSASDLGRVLRFTGACVVTLPATLPAGFYVILRRLTTGVIWVVDAGASVRTYPGGTGISAPDASVVASVDTNVGGAAAAWIIEGAIS